MKPYKFKIRKNWWQFSSFYPFTKRDIKNQDGSFEKGMDLSEDTLGIHSPFGHIIDLGWHGEFWNRKLEGNIFPNRDWDNPIEKVTLKTFKEAVVWVNNWIKKIETIEDKQMWITAAKRRGFMRKFMISLVPKNALIKSEKRDDIRFFRFSLPYKKFKGSRFDFLKNVVLSLHGVKQKIVINNRVNYVIKANSKYHYLLKTKSGIVYFEINYGGRFKIDAENPPTIVIETDHRDFLPISFLKEIKKVVKLLTKKTGFKIFFWDTLKFVEPDELYGKRPKKAIKLLISKRKAQ